MSTLEQRAEIHGDLIELTAFNAELYEVEHTAEDGSVVYRSFPADYKTANALFINEIIQCNRCFATNDRDEIPRQEFDRLIHQMSLDEDRQ